jgi:hypothetical protein
MHINSHIDVPQRSVATQLAGAVHSIVNEFPNNFSPDLSVLFLAKNAGRVITTNLRKATICRIGEL